MTSTALRLPVVGGNGLVDEALGVNPAQRVIADVELPRVVGQDDGVSEPVLSGNCAPQRGFAGHAHRIGRDAQLGQAERGEMGRPLGLGAEFEDVCAQQRVDDAVGQIGGAHVGGRRRIDRVARRSAEQIAQEGKPRLARPGAEGGEPIGAELGRVAGSPGVARAGVVDADVT